MKPLSPSKAKKKHKDFSKKEVARAVREINERFAGWDQESTMTVTYQSVSGKVVPEIKRIFEKEGWEIGVKTYPDGSHFCLDFHPPEINP